MIIISIILAELGQYCWIGCTEEEALSTALAQLRGRPEEQRNNYKPDFKFKRDDQMQHLVTAVLYYNFLISPKEAATKAVSSALLAQY